MAVCTAELISAFLFFAAEKDGWVHAADFSFSVFQG